METLLAMLKGKAKVKCWLRFQALIDFFKAVNPLTTGGHRGRCDRRRFRDFLAEIAVMFPNIPIGATGLNPHPSPMEILQGLSGFGVDEAIALPFKMRTPNSFPVLSQAGSPG